MANMMATALLLLSLLSPAACGFNGNVEARKSRSVRLPRARPLAMLPFDLQRTQMGELRRKVTEGEESFDDGADLFEDDYDDDDYFDDDEYDEYDDDEYDDDDEYYDDDDDYYDDEEESFGTASAPTQKRSLIQRLWKGKGQSADEPGEARSDAGGKWSRGAFSNFIGLRTGHGRPVYWACEGRLTLPSSGKVIAKVLGVEKHTRVAGDGHVPAALSPDALGEESVVDGSTAVAHRAFVFMDAEGAEPLTNHRPHPRARPNAVEPLRVFSSAVTHLLTARGRLGVVAETPEGNVAAAEDLSSVSCKGGMWHSSILGKMRFDMMFFARPGARGLQKLFGEGGAAADKPPLVGFGAPKKEGAAPGVKESLVVSGGSRDAQATYSRFGECPSWVGAPGQMCSLELSYTRASRWQRLPERLRSVMERLVPDFEEGPETLEELRALARPEKKKGWFARD